MKTYSIMIFNRFERFWHWSQMLLIMLLLFTGFGIHGFYSILPFELAVMLHTIAAIILIALWIFAIFWHLTTGTWRHYIPSTNGLLKVAKFYAFGIFQGQRHPYRKSYWRKHNPLQALAYLALKVFLFPLIWISGLAYLTYNSWAGATSELLAPIAWVHVATAFAIAIFIIVHLYLLTTGHSTIKHIKPMITGFDEVDLTDEEAAYLRADEPSHIK
jgi:thiosulfate reductase cytochrome b subunit